MIWTWSLVDRIIDLNITPRVLSHIMDMITITFIYAIFQKSFIAMIILAIELMIFLAFFLIPFAEGTYYRKLKKSKVK